jgi:hypothetical protein
MVVLRPRSEQGNGAGSAREGDGSEYRLAYSNNRRRRCRLLGWMQGHAVDQPFDMQKVVYYDGLDKTSL